MPDLTKARREMTVFVGKTTSVNKGVLMLKRVALALLFVMTIVLLFTVPLHAITCNLLTNQTEYRGGDDMVVSLGADFDRSATVDLYFSLSLGSLSIYWDGQSFHDRPFPWVAAVPVPQGIRFSGAPIFTIPKLPFGLPDSASVGLYTWQFELKEGPQPAATCAAPFAFTCGGGVRSCGQPYLDWLPPCVRVVNTSAPTEISSAGPFAVQLVLESSCSTAVTFTVPAGLMFCSQTPDTQNLVIITDFVIALAPGETRTVVLPAYCIDASWHVPDGPYKIGSLAPDTLMSLVNYVKTKNVPQGFDSSDPNSVSIMMGVQFEIWGLTDECKSFGDIQQALDALLGSR